MQETSDDVLARYRGWIAHHARRLAFQWHVYNDWQDLAQEGWIAMWKALKSYDPELGSEVSYLTTAAMLRMTDCVRKRLWTGVPGARGHRREEPATPIDITWDWVDEACLADEQLDAAEWAYHHGEIAMALDALAPVDRQRVISRILTDGGRFSWRHYELPAHVKATLAERLGHLVEGAAA